MATTTHGPRGKLLGQLWFQVIVATVVGILLGHFQPELGAKMKPFGDAFIALVRMIIAPIIFCTVVHGVAGMNDMKKVGRVALKALIYFEIVTTLALIISLVLVNLWKPGVGMNVDLAALDTSAVGAYVEQAKHQTAVEFLLHIIPTTFASAFVQPDVLQVLFVALLFAFALIAIGEPAKPVFDGVEKLSQVFFKIVGFIMWAAPLGAFGSIAFTVGRFGAESLLSLGNLIAEAFVACAIFTVVVLGGIAWAVGVNLWRLIGYIRDEVVVVAATTSTETVLPRIIQKLKRLGCEESVVGLVVPTGYSFNLDGTCIYLATVTVFLAQATNTHLDLGQQIGLLLVLLLTSKGAAGVAGAAFIVLAATLASLGTIPLASIALVLGIHRILAEGMTFVNLVGNTLATIVVARWERAVDLPTLFAQVGLKKSLPQS
jgi:aerobic C4-dicarboxylate transport protein